MAPVVAPGRGGVKRMVSARSTPVETVTMTASARIVPAVAVWMSRWVAGVRSMRVTTVFRAMGPAPGVEEIGQEGAQAAIGGHQVAIGEFVGAPVLEADRVGVGGGDDGGFPVLGVGGPGEVAGCARGFGEARVGTGGVGVDGVAPGLFGVGVGGLVGLGRSGVGGGEEVTGAAGEGVAERDAGGAGEVDERVVVRGVEPGGAFVEPVAAEQGGAGGAGAAAGGWRRLRG